VDTYLVIQGTPFFVPLVTHEFNLNVLFMTCFSSLMIMNRFITRLAIMIEWIAASGRTDRFMANQMICLSDAT
jgi:hypothetical protein